ncbi:MAG: cyclic nucleotide-binding/CBS domain-containing protein [Nitrospirae bacterium]|nr:cyclic nucleotide-binding/CBS domain-containing protein [Nitrospirota bacterium]
MLIDEVIEFLGSVPPFQFLDGDALKSIAQNISMDFYPKGLVILKQNDPASEHLRIIKKGGVKVFMESESGEEIVIDYRGEGDTFGFLSLIGKDKVRASIMAVDDTICYLLDKEHAVKLMNTYPVFTEYFLKSHLTKYIDRTYSEMHNKSMFFGGSDRILFTSRVADIAIKDIVAVHEDATIQEAAHVMAYHKVSSLVIYDSNNFPVGIVTDRDLREKVVAKGRNVSDPVKNIMSLPLIRVDANDYCFEAVLKMIKHNIHHVLVVRDGILRGVITNHDLMLLQGTSPLSFAKDIENQHSLDGLAPLSDKLNRIIGLLLKEGAKASNITKIISELNDRLVKKVLEIAEKKYGAPPVPYCWIAYGSEGRKEQTFKTDQDNAIIYADPATPEQAEAAKRYFAEFSVFVRDGLVKCGFPPCEANFMASNPQWCQPLSVWKKYFLNWITMPNPEALLKSLILFDFRGLYGTLGLAAELREYLIRNLKDQNLFLAMMASVIMKNRPPLGFFKSFVVEKDGDHKDELNLKIRGIGPLVDIIRFFALESGVHETSSLERLQAMKETHPIVIELGEEIEQAFEFITLLRIHHQLDQMEKKEPLDNFINPSMLSNLEKKSLKESFQLILKIQDAITELYKAGMVAG